MKGKRSAKTLDWLRNDKNTKLVKLETNEVKVRDSIYQFVCETHKNSFNCISVFVIASFKAHSKKNNKIDNLP